MSFAHSSFVVAATMIFQGVAFEREKNIGSGVCVRIQKKKHTHTKTNLAWMFAGIF